MKLSLLANKFILGYLLIPFFFISCSSSNNEEKIILSNDLFYELKEGEVEKEKTKEEIDLYEEYINIDINNQVPLFKIIKGSEYKVFIGLVLNKLPDFSPDQEFNNNFYKKDSLYFLNKHLKTKEANVLITFISKDSLSVITNK